MAFEEVFAAENYCTTACYKIACAIHSNPEPSYGYQWKNHSYSSAEKDHRGYKGSGCLNSNLNRILVNSDGTLKSVEEKVNTVAVQMVVTAGWLVDLTGQAVLWNLEQLFIDTQPDTMVAEVGIIMERLKRPIAPIQIIHNFILVITKELGFIPSSFSLHLSFYLRLSYFTYIDIYSCFC